MARVEVDMRDGALANHLAATLSDAEFELLLRARIKSVFDLVHKHNPELRDSHDSCSFTMSFQNDESVWRVGIGETYGKTWTATGQVLSITIEDATVAMCRSKGNKVSNLLSSPNSAYATNETPF